MNKIVIKIKKLKLFLFAIIPIFLFSSKVNATSIEMYQDQALTIYGYQECTLAKCWDRYKNVKYDGQLYSLNFYSGVSISPLDKYTLTINFRGDDFISSKKDDVAIYNDTSCSVISTQTDGNEYSTYLKIAFVCGQSSNYFKVNVGGLGEEPITGVINYGITGLDIVNETAQDTDKIIAGNDKNTDNIINNNNNNTNTIIDKNKENTDKILDSNKDTQNVIKDQFNSCRDSYNLFKYDVSSDIESKNGITRIINSDGSISFKGTATGYPTFYIKSANPITNFTNYVFSIKTTHNFPAILRVQDLSNPNVYYNIFSGTNYISFNYTSGFFANNNYQLMVWFPSTLLSVGTDVDFTIYPMLQIGSTATEYEPFGEKVCTNKLDEQNKTSKNIWETIKSFPSTFSKFFTDLGDKIGGFFDNLLTGILDGLKSMFIPSDDFFSNWWDGFSAFMKAKLGFLAKPIDIFITFISGYLNLSDTNIVINIPNITVPNFEDNIIIKAQTFNWKELLESKPSFKNLWDLYLDFIDVFLIFNFIGLCEVTYARIFGGDTSAYEYYTVEDSYYYDSESGELQGNPKHSERKTTRRKKV